MRKTDDIQTDGREIAYSEREREFTFAKKWNPICFIQCFSTGQTPPKVPLPVGSSTFPRNACCLDPPHYLRLHLDRFRRFRTAHGREFLCFAMCVRMRFTRD